MLEQSPLQWEFVRLRIKAPRVRSWQRLIWEYPHLSRLIREGDGTLRIIYYCYGSAHSSVVAAAIHLAKLPSRRLPSISRFAVFPILTVHRSSNWE